MRWYLDASVALHAILPFGDRRARRWLLDRHASDNQLISSTLLELEIARALRRDGLDLSRARPVLDRVSLVSLEDGLLHVAANLEPHIKTLDAIHVATCTMLGYGVTLVSHDAAMTAACATLGIATFDPLADM